MFALLVPQIAIGDRPGAMLPAHAFCFESGLDFSASVTREILVHNIPKRQKIIIALEAV
jgi:hypothetical protein